MSGKSETKLEEIQRRGSYWLALLGQGEYWQPNCAPIIRITDMDDRHRRNSAAWVLRQARMIEFCYSAAEQRHLYAPVAVVIGEIDGRPVERLDHEAHMAPTEGSMAADVLDREFADRAADPVAWLKSTALYKALLDGLE